MQPNIAASLRAVQRGISICIKQCLSHEARPTMAFKQNVAAQTDLYKLRGQNQLDLLIQGIEFRDWMSQLPDTV